MSICNETEQYISLDNMYQEMNKEFFNSQLPSCMLVYTRVKNTYGFYCPNQFKYKLSEKNSLIDEISLNPNLFDRPDEEIISTLLHEMVHLWQFHFGNPSRTGYHNKEWAEKMIEVGLYPSSTGNVNGKIVGQKMTHYIIKDGVFYNFIKSILEQKQIIKISGFSFIKSSIISINNDDDNELKIETDIYLPVGTILKTDENILKITSKNENNYSVKLLKGNKPQSKKQYPFSIQRYVQKTTYYCPECNIKVWGKPDLKISCEKCNLRFVEEINA